METEISNSSEQTTDYDDIAQKYDIIEKSDVTLWPHYIIEAKNKYPK